MDEIWEARQKQVDIFCSDNKISQKDCSDIQKIIYDDNYGQVGYVSNFVSILSDGTRMIEWP